MSTLSNLQSTLRRLQSQKTSAEQELRILRQRKSDVETISNSLFRVSDDGAGSINSYLLKTADDLTSAVSGNRNIYVQQSRFAGEKEKGGDADARLSTSLSNLRSELKSTEKKIAELTSEVDRLKISIRNTEKAIDEEKKRVITVT